jgi:predicted HTH domain antitoxin
MQTSIAIPDNLLLSLNMTADETVSSMRKEYAIKMYQNGKLTLGQAAEFCATDKYEFTFLLSSASVPVINYDVDDFKNELKNIGVL